MDSHSALDGLIDQFLDFPEAEGVFGPLHPECSDPGLRQVLLEWLRIHPFLREHLDYVALLERWATLFVRSPATGAAVGIPGCVEFEEALADGFDPATEPWYSFGWTQEESPAPDGGSRTITTGFWFDATGTRPNGVYRSREPDQLMEWYCLTFTEWLRLALAAHR